MSILEQVGRAIHNAKNKGGPWGPACGYPLGAEDNLEFIKVDYDDNHVDSYACDCRAMAAHLLSELIKL